MCVKLSKELPYKNTKDELLPGEVFKPYPDNTYYYVSNLGRVKSIDRSVRRINASYITKTFVKGKIICQCTSKQGYLRVKVSFNNKSITTPVHRMVAKAFLANPENKPQINHKDCNKKNNYLANLEWCTSKENKHHAKANGLAKGEEKKCVYKYDLSGNLISSYESLKEAAAWHEIHQYSITECCLGRRTTYKGFIWRFEGNYGHQEYKPTHKMENAYKYPLCHLLGYSKSGRAKIVLLDADGVTASGACYVNKSQLTNIYI